MFLFEKCGKLPNSRIEATICNVYYDPGCEKRGVHLSETGYFVCGTSVQRTSKHLGYNSYTYKFFWTSHKTHLILSVLFNLPKAQVRVREQKTHLTTGQVNLSFFLALQSFCALNCLCYIQDRLYCVMKKFAPAFLPVYYSTQKT